MSSGAFAIRAQGLGKMFKLGDHAGHDTLRDHLAALFKPRTRRVAQEFWALRDVAFEIPKGEVVGVVGRNGAGKSTLLKVLSEITEPTCGEVRVCGRMASLLEVGTGFHPELTGRENVFLNGAILGMTRAEIARKFDEIVAFAEVEEFLETPVKRYSSGMYVRLAFAVAAHLDSEILIIDEVLAVGDAAFQEKCLRKMDEAANRSGRTVLFVSHNLSAVQRLCTRGLYLEHGKLKADGPIGTVLDAYQRAIDSGSSARLDPASLNPGEARYTGWELAGAEIAHTAPTGHTCEFEIHLASRLHLSDATVGCIIWNAAGEIVAAANTNTNGQPPLTISEGHYIVTVRIRLPIKAGLYQLDVSLNSASKGQIERAFLEPKLNILPPETTLPPKWHGIITEPMHFSLTPAP